MVGHVGDWLAAAGGQITDATCTMKLHDRAGDRSPNDLVS